MNARSEITLKDEDTKYQTEIDGVKVRNVSKVLHKDEHVFRLGKLETTFRIKWQPVVLTFSLSSKEMKKGEDSLNGFRIRLEEFDVKVSTDYIMNQTTHVVAGKRNTAKGIQALINARYIVSETFIDALVYATTPSNLDEAESLSPLEEDFDSNWPKEGEHLPAKSKEPSDRPVENFIPNVERIGVFEGYTFIFCDAAQFTALHAPIANGGGKALEFRLRPGQTSADDIVRFVKNAAGEKGLGELEDGSEGKGVVVVKFRGSKGFEDWAAELDREVAQALDLRLIEQSEFLDAILINDASVLRRPLLPEDPDSAVASNNVQIPSSMEVQEDSVKVSQISVKRRPRGKIVSRFKGFDDGDDDDLPSFAQTAPTVSQQVGKHKKYTSSRRFGTADEMEDEMEVDANDRADGSKATATSRKRPAPSSDAEAEDLIDKLLPAETAVKRRRMEDEANGLPADESLNGISQAQEKARKGKAAKPPRKEIDIQSFVRERREAEENAAREDEQMLKETLEGMTVEEMKNLAVVEEMQLPARQPAGKHFNGDQNSRWDERWNGRKNFKKFRRRGEGTQPGRRGPSLMVPLEEVRRKDFGIGESYWQEDTGTARSQRRSQSRVETQSTLPSQPRRNASSKSARSQPRTAEIPAELVVDVDNSSEPEVVDVDAPRMTRGSERSTQLTEKTSNQSVRTIESQAAPSRKRAASPPRMVPPLVKKRKKFAAARDSDSEDI